jgi:hypothetical protein
MYSHDWRDGTEGTILAPEQVNANEGQTLVRPHAEYSTPRMTCERIKVHSSSDPGYWQYHHLAVLAQSRVECSDC